MRSRAIVIAAPFSLTLGVVASLLAVTLGNFDPSKMSSRTCAFPNVCSCFSAAIREYIWTFAALEFALAAVVLRVFYTAVRVPCSLIAVLPSPFLSLISDLS
ncbi:hypothetical protein Dimus_001314 [Dionaea muscipula]